MGRVVFFLGIALLILCWAPPASASFMSTFPKYMSKGGFRPMDNLRNSLIQLVGMMNEAESRGRQKAYICKGNGGLLECPAGTTIEVLKATFLHVTERKCDPGVTKPDLGLTIDRCMMPEFDYTRSMIQSCDGQTRCYQVTSGFSPCNYLEVEFICTKAGKTPRLKTAFACRFQQLLLGCDYGQQIRVHKAIYGYPAGYNGRCGIRPANESECEYDKTDWVVIQCGGQRHCQITTYEGAFNESCNKDPYLEVVYSCETAYTDQTCKNQEVWGQEEDLRYGNVFSYFNVLKWIQILIMKVQEIIDQLPAQ